MIGKVITRNKSKKSSVRRLNEYIANIDGAGNEEHKVMYSGCLNLGAVDIETATFMMDSDAMRNTRCKDPVLHCLLSWQEGEQPTEEQIKEAASIALEELGLTDQPCIYALHRNTDNFHVHLSVSRIDRETHKAIDAAHGWTKKAMERAARRIEYAQGWAVERNAWSVIETDGTIHENDKSSKSEKKIPQEVKDIENMTGEKSALRIAKEKLASHKFSSWSELHRTLSEYGMRYEKKGSGAVIFVGDVPIKASSAGKRFSLTYLEKLLGTFEDAERIVKVNTSSQHIIEPLTTSHSSSDGWVAYTQQRDEYYRTKKTSKTEMTDRIAAERKALAKSQREEREKYFRSQCWKGRMRELNIKRSEMAARHKAEKLDLADKHAAMRKRFATMYPQFQTYEDWLRSKDKEYEAEKWRHKTDTIYNSSLVSIFPSEQGELPNKEIKDIRGFLSKPHKYGVLFTEPSGKNAFMDTGKSIRVYSDDDAAILASMQLGVEKWGSISLSGTDDYKRRCLAVAVENGIKITNPELQDEYQALLAEKQRKNNSSSIDYTKIDAAQRSFLAYHEAVGADRYRVSATQIKEDGTKRGFIVNKRDGAPDGFTAEELGKKMPRLISLEQNEGRNIYYTPISKDKHHILIDDLSNESLAEMISDGYEPCAMIESSPGNWQAIITIPKLGTEHDREIGNEIVARLNKQYGDPKLSGEVHAHRAPGFENRKPKHQRDDGSYPEVKLAKTEKVMCAKTQQLAAEILDEISERSKASEIKLDKIAASLDSEDRSLLATARAYEVHFRDILKLQTRLAAKNGKTTPDISRIDGMAAVRLRATGHSKENVQAAIETMSPLLREAIGNQSTHQWDDYAARTASYAFGHGGAKNIAQREKYIEHWKELEKRDAEQSRRRHEREDRRYAKPIRRNKGMEL